MLNERIKGLVLFLVSGIWLFDYVYASAFSAFSAVKKFLNSDR